jgi:uncharacterized protein (DUF362 family)/ferredoxin
MEGVMSQSTVALVRCPTYDPDLVYEALSRGVELLGGVDRFVTPGERLLLKPNLLAGDDPDKVVTTHPSVLAASTRLFQEGGATVCFGDSPGLDRPARAAERAGLMEAGTRSGAEFVDFSSGSRMDNPGGELVSGFPIAQPVQECDAIINLPKMKSHQLTRITGAVKNLFGSVPGQRKALYHVQFPDVMAFCTLLVELNLRLRPRLHVMDGVVAMEGNGPRSGDPRPMGVLILSDDPIAVDAAFCRIIALDPKFIPTNVIGQRQGLGHFQERDVEFVGDPLESFVDPDFKIIRKPVYSNASYAHYNIIKNAVLPRPVIDPDRCIKCGRCVEACPVPDKALRFADGRRQPPRYDYNRCIRCYCCHEMCPERAIDKKMPLLGRILHLG